MFHVSPDDISGFDGLKLVQLLRRLLYAEAHAAGVPLFNVAAPLQITIADGGEDAHVIWTGGETQTPFFPHRDVIFQCKASDQGDAGWKKETWTKSSQRGKNKPRVLNNAVSGALARGAAYIGVTLTPLVGEKPEERAEAIKAGIGEAKGDPSKLHCVRLYDGNTLSAWINRHHAVALWVKEQHAGISLSSFRTLEQWGQRVEMASHPYFPGDEARFAIGNTPDDRLTFSQFATRLATDIVGGNVRSARVTGASGLGKTRSVLEAVRGGGAALKHMMAAQTVFCDFRHVSSGTLWDAANSFATHDTPLVLVVDECPRDDAKKLHDIASAAGSALRVITIDTDNRPISVDDCLAVEVLAAEEDLIRSLLATLLPDASDGERAVIADLCAGFPRIAVLASKDLGDGAVFKSVMDAAERILRGARLTNPDARRALGCLALFRSLSFDRPAEAFDDVATRLARMTGDELYDHLVTAVDVELAGRYGGELSAQPRPIANVLGLERLKHLRPSVIRRFLEDAPIDQRQGMLARFPHLSQSPTLGSAVLEMLGYGGALHRPDEILTNQGAEFLDAFVHVTPDPVAVAIHDAILTTSIDQLATVGDITGILNALQRLAFRNDTFPNALRDLLRLSAAEYEQGGGRATEIVEHLFHLQLSGTAAPSRARYLVLDEALGDEDLRLRWSAVRALRGGLELDRFMRSSGFEVLGSEPPATDWSPKTPDEAVDHILSALSRLTQIRRQGGNLATLADQAVAGALRRLLWPELMEAVRAYISEARREQRFWFAGTKAIGDWLYFDRSSRSPEFGAEVRQLYDELLPTDAVEQAVLFSKFWPSDLRDPDLVYRPSDSVQDYQYAGRRAAALAPVIAADRESLSRTIKRMTGTRLNAPTPFTDALAPLILDPEGVFGEALAMLDEHGEAGFGFVLSLLRSLDKAHPSASERLAELAQNSSILNRRQIAVYSALRLTPTRLRRIAENVESGAISPDEAAPLSYGRSMDGLSIEEIQPLLSALVGRHREGGSWAAVEVLSMYFYGRQSVSSPEAAAIKAVLLAPLGEELRGGGVSGHAYGVLIGLLDSSGFMDDAFAHGLTDQIIAFCQSGPNAYGSSLAEALQEALTTVVRRTPEPVWRLLAAFYEVASRTERARLSDMMTQGSVLREGTDAFEAGLLFDVPLELLIDWVTPDPAGRIKFLISFFPILCTTDDGDIEWHPALRMLLDRFASVRELQEALYARIFPRSWSGSIEAYVSPFIKPLTGLKDHEFLGLWASESLHRIERRLKADW